MDIKLMTQADGYGLGNLALPPNNEIILDDKGLPSVMVKLPKMTYQDLGLPGTGTHPAWIVNGREVPYIYVSKYGNVEIDGRAYSLPYKAPRANVTFDEAVQLCEAKGAGWHLMSNVEWSAISNGCAKNGCMPGGNNNASYGDYYATSEKGAPMPTYDDNYGGDVPYTAGGSGPKSWFHNNDFSGIADLNGNVYEWVGGIRMKNGEVNIIKDNDTVLHKDQGADSAEWKAILPGTNVNNATLVAPGTNGTLISIEGGLGVNGTDSKADSYGTTFARTAENCSAALANKIPKLAYAHNLVVPSIETDRQDYAYIGASGETLFYRGGDYRVNFYAGVFYLNGSNGRSYSYYDLGFRSAFVPPEFC